MFCTKCGNKNDDNTKFCTNCGAKLEPTQTPPTPPTQQPPVTPQKKNNKPLIIVAIVVGFFLLCVILGIIFAEPKSKDDDSAQKSQTTTVAASSAENTTTTATTTTPATTTTTTTTTTKPKPVAPVYNNGEEIWIKGKVTDVSGKTLSLDDYDGFTWKVNISGIEKVDELKKLVSGKYVKLTGKVTGSLAVDFVDIATGGKTYTKSNFQKSKPAISTEDSYEHNQYYDITETATLENSIGYTIIIHKVLAKQDVSISSSMIAYSNDNSVIGKSEDNIKLTKGESNFFRYVFEADVSNAFFKTTYKTKSASILDGERDSVELVEYNHVEDNLYLTFKQKVDKLGTFSKFKLLFYKNNQIVHTEDGYFNIYAENLTGNGTTDVAELWIYGVDFDNLEYIFEP